MTRHYPDPGSASYWLCRVGNLIQPIRSTTQIWVVTRHQCGISALVSQTSFGRETSGSVAKCRLFSQATMVTFSYPFRGVVSFKSHKNQLSESAVRRGLRFILFIRQASLTVWRCQYKRSTFLSVIYSHSLLNRSNRPCGTRSLLPLVTSSVLRPRTTLFANLCRVKRSFKTLPE